MGGSHSKAGATGAGLETGDISAADGEEDSVVCRARAQCLSASSDLLHRYSSYADCQALISVAISNPSSVNVDAAWAAVVPNVEFQGQLYDFALAAVDSVRSLVAYVATQRGKPLDTLVRHPLAAKTMCDMCDVIIGFDQTTASLPRLLGDMSFFRRTVSRRPDFAQFESLFAKTNEMAMFFATPSGLLAKTVEAVRTATGQPSDPARLLQVFEALVELCIRARTAARNAVWDRAIVASILAYDALAPRGALRPKSGIATLRAVQAIAADGPPAAGLLNLIKYRSKHYGEPATSGRIKAIIG
jgi:hypothetical protein